MYPQVDSGPRHGHFVAPFVGTFTAATHNNTVHLQTVVVTHAVTDVCSFNPFSDLACKISGAEEYTLARLQTIVFDGPVTNLLSVLSILIEVLSRTHAKRGKPS